MSLFAKFPAGRQIPDFSIRKEKSISEKWTFGGVGREGRGSVPYYTDYSQGDASCPKSRPLTGSWSTRIKITSLISRICTLRFHMANFIVWIALAKLYNGYEATWTIKTVKIAYYFSPNAGLSEYIQETLIELLLHRLNSKYPTVMTTVSQGLCSESWNIASLNPHISQIYFLSLGN